MVQENQDYDGDNDNSDSEFIGIDGLQVAI